MAPAEGSSNGTHKRQLVGFDNFKRSNPMTDRFEAIRFHHIEFYCGDANTTYRRFQWGLGMQLVAKSDLSTGNQSYASYVLQSNELVFVFTAPYSANIERTSSKEPLQSFSREGAKDFVNVHGLGVKAVGILVADARKAYEETVGNGAIGVLQPTELTDGSTGKGVVVSEIKAYGDVVLRFVSTEGFDGPFLPKYEPVQGFQLCYGLERLDHAVGNVPKLLETIDYLANATGFHEFAEFTAQDIGTVDSGLNSMVLASNNERVILPVNEPTFGTKRKSQIQTYLEHNEGPGLQHLALKCDDIFTTLREMRKRTEIGGFDFMPRPSDGYYKKLPEKVGSDLTPEQLKECQELGILVDKDDQGILLQIFTKPLGDRPTIFIEIIQRIGCNYEVNGKVMQKGGCGGFGKGNFSELFKSIEDYERTLDAKV